MLTTYQHVSAELRLFHGSESLVALKRELDRSGCRRAVVLCGRTVGRSSEMQVLEQALGASFAGTTTSVREHSPVASIEEAARYLTDVQADAIVAVGGGSAAVTARATAILAGEKRPLSELSTRRCPDGRFESPRLDAAKVPVFMVPTTPSTAFAKAGTAVHADDGERLALFDPKTRARAIFIHPGFVRTSPPGLVQSAVLNALANAVEAIESPQCDPVSEAFLMQALRMIRRGLEPAAADDPATREQLVVAAILCGRGTEQGGTGLASVLAHAIGKRSHVANGIVNAIVLPHTMRYNAPVTQSRTPALLEALAGPGGCAEALSGSEQVTRLLSLLPVPRRLREIHVKREELAEIADAAMADWFISRNARPVKDVATLLELLEAAW